MTTARVQPFRAGRMPWTGRTPAQDHALADSHLQAHASGTKTLAVDLSEFQPDINDAAYLAWSKAIVIRAAYGASHDDRAWYGGDRRKQLRDGGAAFTGIYQYVTAFEDVTAQAREFCRLIGTLVTGEYPLADWEEGSGSQAGRRSAWNHVVEGELGFAPGTGYSGISFARDHGLAPVEWVAAYQGAPPPMPWLLWQFTDAFPVPGVGQADCSVYDGPVSALAAHAYGGVPASPPAQAPPFPYPAGHYLGVTSADPAAHSGNRAGEHQYVLAWQARMASRGWTITADGDYGARSEAVCRAFQAEAAQEGFDTGGIDGRVGPRTWALTWTKPVT